MPAAGRVKGWHGSCQRLLRQTLKPATGEARLYDGSKEPAEPAKESSGSNARELRNNQKEHLEFFYFLKKICHSAINLLKWLCTKGLRGGGRFGFYGRYSKKLPYLLVF